MFRSKKCGLLKLFIILALLFVPLLESVDVFAVSPNTKKINFYLRAFYEQNYSWSQYRDSGFTHSFSGIQAVRQYGIQYENIYTTGNYASLHFETNIVGVAETRTNPQNAFRWLNLDRIVVKSCSFNGNTITIETNNVETVITPWWQEIESGVWSYSSTLTLYGDVTLSNIPSNTAGTFVCDVGTDINNDYFWSNESTGSYIYWEKNPSNLIFGTSLNDSLLQTQINQNNTIINMSQEYYDANYEAIDNIENQNSSDIQGAENTQTTSIIGTISSFVSALGNVQTGSCELTLPFPDYAGGSVQANPCSYKEKAPTIVTIGSSLVLIGLFIPLAFVVLRMIYNEIRSWTNG